MAKRAKGAAEGARERTGSAPGLLDSAQQVWLAGLGALAKAQEEGSRLFESLVRKGEEVESHKGEDYDTRQDLDRRVEQLRERAAGGWSRVEQRVEERVSQVLDRLEVAKRQDIEDLTARLERLERSLAELQKGQKGPPRASRSRSGSSSARSRR